MDPWVVQVLREGYQIPLLTFPPLSEVPIHLPSYSPSSIKGKALVSEINLLLAKGAIEPAPPSPGFYSRLFVVLKASGSWRPVIDLSTFNKFVRGTKFRMETNQSVLSSVRKDDWMVSVDLKDAYLQVPIHPNSRKYLRFVSPTGVFQFRSLCFGLTTAPQVFTRVMAPVSSILHSLGVRMLRYLDDWLIQASSREQCLWARDTVLSLCQELGVIVNLEKSNLSPSQTSTYLGIDINSRTLTASPTLERRERLLWIIEEFLSSEGQPAEIWRRLLGHLASLIQIVRGGRLRMRSLQIVLRQQWDFVNDQMVIEWSPQCKADLLWWNDMSRLSQGVSLLQIQPDLQMWTDSSDLGWGAHLVSTPVSGRWSEKESPHPINWKELRAIHLGLRHFSHLLEGQAVAVFCDNATAIAYLRNQGGDFLIAAEPRSPGNPTLGREQADHTSSPVHPGETQRSGRRSVTPQPGDWVGVDPDPRSGGQTPASLAGDSGSVCHIPQPSPSGLLLSSPRSDERRDGCPTSILGQHESIRFPTICPGPAGFEQGQELSQSGTHPHCSSLASERMVSRPPRASDGSTVLPARTEGSTQTAPFPQVSPQSPRAASSRLETIQRFARHQGYSRRVAKQISFARRKSTNLVYQSKWEIYRAWCRKEGHSISRPSLPKIADFLLYLHSVRRLSLSCIKGYRSMLSSIFRWKLPDIASDPVLQDLVRSFLVQRPFPRLSPPSWDLNLVLQALLRPPFEPLSETSFRNLTKKTVFLVSLATAHRVGELQALSRRVAKVGRDMSLSYLPEFVAKTESTSNPIPRSFLVKSLAEFVGNLEEEQLLCPVRALKYYLKATNDIVQRPHNLFVSPRCRTRPMSKNALSFFIRETIASSRHLEDFEGHAPKAHSVRSVSTSIAFQKNWSTDAVLKAATWKTNSVFTSFYLKDVAHVYDNCMSLGPFVAAGQVIGS